MATLNAQTIETFVSFCGGRLPSMSKAIRGRYEPRSTLLAIRPEAFGMLFDAPPSDRAFELAVGGAVAVVEVCGPLTRQPGWFWESYEEIGARVQKALESSARCVMLKIDSPGGDAVGCFECARALRAAAKAAGKPLVAYADGTAASAAYALACSAEKIFVPPDALVGSVGVMAMLIDVTAADAMNGVQFTLLTSGARKADGNPHVPLTAAAREELQDRVDSLATLFFGLVSEFRPGLTDAEVKGFEGRMFQGEAAVQAGLADGVASWTEVLALAVGAKAEGTKPTTAARSATGAADPLAGLLRSIAASDVNASRRVAAEELLVRLEDPRGTTAAETTSLREVTRSVMSTADTTSLRSELAEFGDFLRFVAGDPKKDAPAPPKKKEEFMPTEAEFEQLKKQVADLTKKLADKDQGAEKDEDPKSRADVIKKCRTVLSDPKSTAAQKEGAKEAIAILSEEDDGDAKSAAYIDRMMGLSSGLTGITDTPDGRGGSTFEMGLLTPEQARAHRDRLDREGRGFPR